MAGRRSVWERRWPSVRRPQPWLGVLLAFLTLFAPALPNAAAARPDVPRFATPRTDAPASARAGVEQAMRQAGPDVHAVARSAERRLAAAVAASEEDDADETPRDVHRVRQQPATPGLSARAVLPEPCPTGAPPPVAHGQRRTAADETPPESVFRCNPDGRGPPRRP